MDRLTNAIASSMLEWCLDNKVILDFTREKPNGAGIVKIFLLDPAETVEGVSFFEAVRKAKEFLEGNGRV